MSGNPIKYIDPTGEAFFLAPLLLSGTGVTTTGGAGAFGTMVLGLGTAWALNQNRPERSPQEEAQAQEEYLQIKDPCDNHPTGNDCSALSKQISHTQMCINLYQAWDSKWLSGTPFASKHAAKLQGWANRLQALKEKHKRECTNKCPE